ncbi:maternal effect embryo arrest 60 [Forsythia ovata]|uniref:Maternal effect embryo arrest 60 n=1 Tax=Forsythia ovata TaxID=205694 RepID=A0ABD1X8M8_9LAMI
MSETPVPKLATSIHITALDGIINVNSLFTLAVFIGLTWNPTDPKNSLIDPVRQTDCSPGLKVAEDLVTFHVYSFSCFLFSSLIALGLKQAIRLSRSANWDRTLWNIDLAHVNQTLLRVGYLISAVGSVCGSVFLMLALVNVVQIKLGMLRCGSRHGYGAVVPLGKYYQIGV